MTKKTNTGKSVLLHEKTELVDKKKTEFKNNGLERERKALPMI